MSQLLEKLVETNKTELPGLITKQHTIEELADINSIIKSKQTISIQKHDLENLYKCLSDEVQLALRRKSNNKVKTLTAECEDVVYDNFGYLGTFDVFSISPDYIEYIKTNTPEELKLNIYNIEGSKKFPEFLKKYLLYPDKIPQYEYAAPKNIKYTEFSKTKYKNYFNLDKSPVSCLMTNLPYEYYKDIQLLDFNACYDLNKQDFWFTGDSVCVHNIILDKMAAEGIREPLYLKIDGGTVVSANDYHWLLLIAKQLKLPSIPVCLYVTGQEIDNFEKFMTRKKDKSLISKICAPYIIFDE